MINGYSNHYSYELEYYYKKNIIVIFYILPYSFYLFQPFNIGYFNILKQSYNKEIKNFIRSYINYIIKLNFFTYFYIIFFTTFNKENIRVGFRSINLVSFNPKIIIFKFNIKLYISILIKSLSTEIDFWIFKIL